MFAIVWDESGININPWLRGHHCWNAMVHELDCETGPFQIKPSTAMLRCPNLNVFVYVDNVTCFIKMFNEDSIKKGRIYAIKHQNGNGPDADAYVKRILASIGWLIEVYGT
jgi:hypothetical protein